MSTNEKNMISEEQRKQKNKNAKLITVESSIRVVVGFVEQTIILQALGDLAGKWFYLIVGAISFVIAVIVCSILVKRARKWIETQEEYSGSINSKVVDIATLLGYFSIGLCVVELISGIAEKFALITPEFFQWKWGFIIVITLCSFLIPLLPKNEKSNK